MTQAGMRPSWFARVAPLGVRFLDAATGAPVSDRLRVLSWPSELPLHRRQARCNRSGTWYFEQLPGVASFAEERAEAFSWGEATRSFILDVHDPAGRYVSTRLNVDVPRLGLLTAPGSAVGGVVPLHPAAGRSFGGALAVIRARLASKLRVATDAAGRERYVVKPASWAVLEATLPDGSVVRSIADATGAVVLAFPWPASEAGAGESASPPLHEQKWTVGLEARSSSLESSRPVLDDDPPGRAAPPLAAILGQDACTIAGACSADGSLLAPMRDATIRFGRETALRTIVPPVEAFEPPDVLLLA